jgi:hypothetical protein
MFDQMVSNLTDVKVSTVKLITLTDYEQWQELYTWDAIQDQRYGQSFCNYFDITDYRLFYERDWVRCDRIIRKDYIRSV